MNHANIDFTTAKILKKNTKRIVFLARTSKFLEPHPGYFIVKCYSDPNPEEPEIQKALISSFPETLSILDSWTFENKFYITQKYLESGDLHNYLAFLNGKPLGLQYALSYCGQLADQLAKLHSLKIVHRDIKPLNVFLTKDLLTLKIWDFGEACWDSDIEKLKMPVGTLSYMSLEMIEKYIGNYEYIQNPYREDIWALGKTFFEIFISRLCPETLGMGVAELHDYIDERLEEKEYDWEIAGLIKGMMCSEESFLSAEGVLNEVNRLAQTLLFQEKDLAGCYDKTSFIEKEKKDQEAEADLDDISDELGIGLIQGSSLYFNRDKVKKLSLEVNENDERKTNINSDLSQDNYEVTEDDEYMPNIIHDSFEIFSALNQMKKCKHIERSKNLSTNDLEINGNNGNLIFCEGLELKNDLDIKKNRFASFSQQEPTISIENSINAITSSFIKNHRNGGRKERCEYCRKDGMDYIELPCRHFYHKECFKHSYEPEILKLNLQKELECSRCSKVIPVSFLENCNIFKGKTLLIIMLQSFSRSIMNCDYCEDRLNPFSFTLLNKNLKPETLSCPKCSKKFCSFCGKKHFFLASCSSFNDFCNRINQED